MLKSKKKVNFKRKRKRLKRYIFQKIADTFVIALDSVFDDLSNETLYRLSRHEFLKDISLGILEDALELSNTETLAGSCCCDSCEYLNSNDFSEFQDVFKLNHFEYEKFEYPESVLKFIDSEFRKSE